VLDPGARTLTLFQGPAPLRAWIVATVEAGPRRLGSWGSIGHDWHTRAWSEPRLDPPLRRVRRVIESDSVTPPDPSDTDAWIPPTPEEAVPTPARFVAHHEGGLGLEVVAVGEGAPPRGVSGAIADLLRLPSPWGDRYRVRLTMEASEAGALYRTYPPDASLVIILTTPTQNETQP
jgi:hypothetical protein